MYKSEIISCVLLGIFLRKNEYFYRSIFDRSYWNILPEVIEIIQKFLKIIFDFHTLVTTFFIIILYSSFVI